MLRFIGKIIKLFVVFNVLAVVAGVIARQLVEPDGDETTDEFTLPTIMYGTQFASTAAALRHGSLITYMGGAEIDLTGATLADHATLTVLTIMGGVEIRVPPHWRVDFTSEVYAGDSQERLDGQDALPEDAPLLRVDARTVMGGLEITNRPRRTTSPTP